VADTEIVAEEPVAVPDVAGEERPNPDVAEPAPKGEGVPASIIVATSGPKRAGIGTISAVTRTGSTQVAR
jgi:hypothetical protein